jgi:hypothetical protein
MEKEGEEKKQLEEKLSIACEVAESRLSVAWNAIDSLDSKINGGFGFASAILGLLAGFYSLESNRLPFTSLLLLGFAAFTYILLVIISIFAYRAKNWSYRPDIKTLLKYCESEKITEIKEWLANECKLSFDSILKNLKKKATLTNWVLILLAIETLLLTSGLFYSLV